MSLRAIKKPLDAAVLSAMERVRQRECERIAAAKHAALVVAHVAAWAVSNRGQNEMKEAKRQQEKAENDTARAAHARQVAAGKVTHRSRRS